MLFKAGLIFATVSLI